MYLYIFIFLFISGCNSRTPGLPDFTLGNYNEPSNKYQKLIQKYNPKVSKDHISKILSSVNFHSRTNKIDPKLVLAVMAKESSFRHKAVSSAGAMGLGQLMPSTAKDMGVSDPFSPEQNIRGMTRYLGMLLKKYQGNLDKALSAYNFGPNAVDKTLKSGKKLPLCVINYVQGVKNLYFKI